MPEKIWKKFVKDIKSIVPNIDLSVLNKLRCTFFEMPEDYYSSEKCTKLVSNTLKNISDNRLKVYIHLLEFKKVMKATQKMKRKSLKIQNEIIEVEPKKIRLTSDLNVEDQAYMTFEGELNNGISSDIVLNEVINKNDLISAEEEISIEKSPTNVNDRHLIDKYIQKLENVLHATKDQIEKLEEQELSLDDLDNEMSAFVLLDKLKAHYVKVWKKVSKLQDKKCNLRNKYLKLFQFSGSGYSELDCDVEDFVKQKKFPDYHDIRNLVVDYSNKHSLNLSSQKISELTIDIFTQIGNKLKKLRISEFVKYFGNHLTDQVRFEDDPMIRDSMLRKILHKNHVDGEIKMDLVIETYVKLQQANDMTDNQDNESEISTEHSISSDEEESEKKLEEKLLEFPVNYEKDKEKSCDSVKPIDNDNSNNDADDGNDDVNHVHHQDNSFHIENNMVNGNNHSYEAEKHAPIIPVTTETIPPSVDCIELSVVKEKPSEEYINEIISTTFQFNVDQMKNGDKSKYYSDIIVLNSDDETDESSDSSSSNHDDGDDDDVIDVDNNNFAYSTKLDDFLITKSVSKLSEPKEIFITLDDDDDDDDVQEIMTENATAVACRKISKTGK